MTPLAFYRQTILWLRYRRAAFVTSRDELDAAMQKRPPRIVVDGDEALRAYAAALASPGQGGASGPASRRDLAAADSAAPLAVPPVGRITDGWRVKRRGGRMPRRLPQGTGLPVLVFGGTIAALLAEILFSFGWPAGDPHLLAHGKALPGLAPVTFVTWLQRGAAVLLGLAAALCYARAIWIVLALGVPVRTEWRVEYRVPGRLVMVRVRRRRAA